MIRLALLLTLASPAFARAASPDPRVLASYGFDASAPLPRARTIPPWLLEAWAAEDKLPYKAHALTAGEEAVLARAVADLPAPMRKVLSERLIAIYFVDGLRGNGITDWVLDSSSRTFTYMILNPAGFRQTLSALLTERDRSAFRGEPEIAVEAGEREGILYTVAHESTHAVDYVTGITAYTEKGQFLATHPGRSAEQSWDVWKRYSTPKDGNDYPLRSKLHFYGFHEPELDASQAGALCAQWAASPFPSLYGSLAWAEDLAELFVLRHLTQDLHQPVRRVCAGKTYEPWASPAVRRRALKLTEPLYR